MSRPDLELIYCQGPDRPKKSMSTQTRLTLPDLLYYLRQRLMDAAEHRDQPSLVEIQNTLVVLQEAAWGSRDEALANIAEDMIDATRDALTGD